jgi:hypothetical protein
MAKAQMRPLAPLVAAPGVDRDRSAGWLLRSGSGDLLVADGSLSRSMGSRRSIRDAIRGWLSRTRTGAANDQVDDCDDQ